MTLPDNERSRPVDRAASLKSDRPAGSDHDQYTAIPDILAVERAVVGACIASKDITRREVHKIMVNSDLVDPLCRFVDGVMRRMDAEKVHVDAVTLPGFVRQYALAPTPAAASQLWVQVADLVDAAPVPAQATWYALNVVQASTRRALVAVALEIRRLAEDGALDALNEKVGEQGRRAMAAIARAEAVNA